MIVIIGDFECEIARGKITILLGVMQNQMPRQPRHVAGGADLLRVVEAVGIVKPG